MSGEHSNEKCSKCLEGCRGFLTDREKRKLCGMGVLYVVGFPILLVMIVVGALKAAPPGEENPTCPAEPNMPWFLVTGGAGISILLIIRIILIKLTHYIKNNQDCCDQVTGCFCEFGCNLMYDIMVIVFIVLWMITVTWWVFRHMIGPQPLYYVLGKEGLDNFRASLGDNDTIHDIQWSEPEAENYCDGLLYLFTFVLLCLCWFILVGTVMVFLVDKILNKIVCCKLCQNIKDQPSEDDEEMVKLKSTQSTTIEY